MADLPARKEPPPRPSLVPIGQKTCWASASVKTLCSREFLVIAWNRTPVPPSSPPLSLVPVPTELSRLTVSLRFFLKLCHFYACSQKVPYHISRLKRCAFPITVLLNSAAKILYFHFPLHTMVYGHNMHFFQTCKQPNKAINRNFGPFINKNSCFF